MAGPLTPLALPDDPAVAAWASALNAAGEMAFVVDAGWRYAFVTDEMRVAIADTGGDATTTLGFHFASPEAMRFRRTVFKGPWVELAYRRSWFSEWGSYFLGSSADARDELRRVVDADLVDIVAELQPKSLPRVWATPSRWTIWGGETPGATVFVRIDDERGDFAGMCFVSKPAAGMSHLIAAAGRADLVHLERMHAVARAERRPAAILMTDLEASSPLARRLSSAEYFAFGRRYVRAADKCVIDAGGIVGPHTGDGVAGLFLAEVCGSESAAARSCITAAKNLRDALDDLVRTYGSVSGPEWLFRFGLHWGATLYVGRILTPGRSEVNALGDEMNEAARIEACATGGRTLASKALLERLDREDSAALGLDTRSLTYVPLAELGSATEKARRDAGSIAVCEI